MRKLDRDSRTEFIDTKNGSQARIMRQPPAFRNMRIAGRSLAQLGVEGMRAYGLEGGPGGLAASVLADRDSLGMANRDASGSGDGGSHDALADGVAVRGFHRPIQPSASRDAGPTPSSDAQMPSPFIEQLRGDVARMISLVESRTPTLDLDAGAFEIAPMKDMPSQARSLHVAVPATPAPESSAPAGPAQAASASAAEAPAPETTALTSPLMNQVASGMDAVTSAVAASPNTVKVSVPTDLAAPMATAFNGASVVGAPGAAQAVVAAAARAPSIAASPGAAGAGLPGVTAEWVQRRQEAINGARAFDEQLRADPAVRAQFTKTVDISTGESGPMWRAEFDENAYRAWLPSQPNPALTELAALYGMDPQTLAAQRPDVMAMVYGREPVGLYEGMPPAGHVMARPEALAELDATLESDLSRAMIKEYGSGPLPPLAPDNAVAHEQLRQYGPERFEKMRRLEMATRHVQAEFGNALQAAKDDPTHSAPGWTTQTVATTSTTESGVQFTTMQVVHTFSVDAFGQSYAARPDPVARLFTAMYGQARADKVAAPTDESGRPIGPPTDAVYFVDAATGERNKLGYDVETHRVQMDEMRMLSLDDLPDLYRADAVGWHPTFGFMTSKENVKPKEDFFWDTVAPMIVPLFASLIIPGAFGAFSSTLGAFFGGAVAGALASDQAGHFSWTAVWKGGATALASSMIGNWTNDVLGKSHAMTPYVSGGLSGAAGAAINGGDIGVGVAFGIAGGVGRNVQAATGSAALGTAAGIAATTAVAAATGGNAKATAASGIVQGALTSGQREPDAAAEVDGERAPRKDAPPPLADAERGIPSGIEVFPGRRSVGVSQASPAMPPEPDGPSPKDRSGVGRGGAGSATGGMDKSDPERGMPASASDRSAPAVTTSARDDQHIGDLPAGPDHDPETNVAGRTVVPGAIDHHNGPDVAPVLQLDDPYLQDDGSRIHEVRDQASGKVVGRVVDTGAERQVQVRNAETGDWETVGQGQIPPDESIGMGTPVSHPLIRAGKLFLERALPLVGSAMLPKPPSDSQRTGSGDGAQSSPVPGHPDERNAANDASRVQADGDSRSSSGLSRSRGRPEARTIGDGGAASAASSRPVGPSGQSGVSPYVDRKPPEKGDNIWSNPVPTNGGSEPRNGATPPYPDQSQQSGGTSTAHDGPPPEVDPDMINVPAPATRPEDITFEDRAKGDPPVPNAIPGRETSGRTQQWEVPGGTMEDADKDFDNMNPENVKSIPGGRIGILPDGRRINVREDSSAKVPTIEIIDGGRRVKIRYKG